MIGLYWTEMYFSILKIVQNMTLSVFRIVINITAFKVELIILFILGVLFGINEEKFLGH